MTSIKVKLNKSDRQTNIYKCRVPIMYHSTFQELLNKKFRNPPK